MENESNSKHCPQCGKENPNDAGYCNACGSSFTQTQDAQQRVDVKMSKIATVSFVCALCGLVLLSPSLILNPRQKWIGITFMASFIILAVSFVLGLIGIIQNERTGSRKTGRLFAVGAVLISVFGGLLPAWSVVIRLPRSTAFRMVCGTNLCGLGKAMLTRLEGGQSIRCFRNAGGRGRRPGEYLLQPLFPGQIL
jgi:predicted nucleic acid-binding Zn ribbon protein